MGNDTLSYSEYRLDSDGVHAGRYRLVAAHAEQLRKVVRRTFKPGQRFVFGVFQHDEVFSRRAAAHHAAFLPFGAPHAKAGGQA